MNSRAHSILVPQAPVTLRTTLYGDSFLTKLWFMIIFTRSNVRILRLLIFHPLQYLTSSCLLWSHSILTWSRRIYNFVYVFFTNFRLMWNVNKLWIIILSAGGRLNLGILEALSTNLSTFHRFRIGYAIRLRSWSLLNLFISKTLSNWTWLNSLLFAGHIISWSRRLNRFRYSKARFYGNLSTGIAKAGCRCICSRSWYIFIKVHKHFWW